MTTPEWLLHTASLPDYQRQAEALLSALRSGAEEARWRFKWQHPRFHSKSVTEVGEATLDLADAQTVIARDYGFETWVDLALFTDAVRGDEAIRQFEAAVGAVVSGDVETLQSLLRDDATLVRARSSRRHHATMLHYVAANGVEDARQKTSSNAVAVAKMLLDAGAEVDALAVMYGARCTTMSMLVSSEHPERAGLQAVLAEILLDYGAAFSGPGSNWQSALMTALAFGYLRTAQVLEKRGAPVENVSAAAGLGRVEDVLRLLPDADEKSRHVAMALAAQHGHEPIVRLLIDAGEDPDRYNPEGFHSHSTPLHQAVLSNHVGVVELLVTQGARLDIRDTIYGGTPLDWAIYGSRASIADYLRAHGAATT